jgi:thioesterase domain-containing protein
LEVNKQALHQRRFSLATATEMRISLEKTFHEKIPITRAMEIRVDAYDGTALTISAPLAANVNDKGTAFGGSLYSVLVLAGWGLLHLKLQEEAIVGNVMIHKCSVTYSRPVTADWQARCQLPNRTEYDRFIQELTSKGRARLRLDVTIMTGEHVAVRFQGSYAAVLPQSDRSIPPRQPS